MAGLLLLGLLVCTPLVVAQPLATVIISELCYYNVDTRYLAEQMSPIVLNILAKEDFCGDFQRTLHLATTKPTLTQTTVTPVIASLEPELCSTASVLASYQNVSLSTWNCPQGLKEEMNNNSGPSLTHVARAFALMVTNMKWKSVALVSTGLGWWSSLSQLLDIHLRGIGIIPRHYFMIELNASQEQIENTLRIMKKTVCRAVILCLPANGLGRKILRVIDKLQIASIHNTVTILMDVSALPSWTHLFHPELETNYTTAIPIAPLLNLTVNLTELPETHNRDLETFKDEIGFSTKTYILIVSEVDVDKNVFFNESECYTIENEVLRNLKRSVNTSLVDFKFVLLDIRDDDTFRPLLSVTVSNRTEYNLSKIAENIDEWSVKHIQSDECENCDAEFAKLLSVLAILGCSSISVVVIFGVAALARYQLLKKRVAKGPYKVLLTATDFVFPQIADSRRVDEGIEAMLCCWLQQLQEFGGPEVDKPDLLQGSGGNTRTPLRGGSSPSLAKQLIVDPRVRYNGDLVQMKPVPCGSGGVELRAKTVELLVLLHGLRHENLNPLIGCLAEPPRAALVSEWCARGSLQDVLQQDDIKLDWSFRLSLLTDLVRGMKYLHTTPIRVHGYLTSRNCVIDARWVLKVTDYGLPAFYEAQGITPPQKSARELLWTAPELLRHSSLRKKGTQTGDVYSFGIILQEVVVRGEPFCMLALTPEEIIEKVKRPPPLIRPSVSKGAAPPEAINIMRQCWAEQADMRPDFNTVHDQFKKLNHGRKVNIVDTMFQMLEKYSNNLEELIRERTEQLDIEKKKTEQLLNRMLPSSVAEKLKLGMPVDPEEFEEVTIYFSDIVGFTTISAHSTPFQVVDLLNDLYTCFDATINAYNVYKVETIGDAYMVVGGVPVRVSDHAEQIATMALDLLHQSGKFCIRHLPGTPLRLRIGLHTGPCCAGVVGLTMPRYCLFGDTVNTASRMESTGAAWRIHLSETTKERLEKAGGYQLEYRGLTDVKGKGTMHTYWLLGKAGFDKPLPVPPPIDLDESLIICKPDFEQIEDTSSYIATPPQEPLNARQSHDHFAESAPPRSPHPDPTFIKTMECSKFSTLIKSQDNDNYHHMMVKSTSSDTPMSLGTPVSASEVAAALLGASTSSLCGFRRHKRIQEDDLSTPYNHYKCLSPKERVGKLLRRQFSLDRTEEILNENSQNVSPRLCKQNSAGAADLEKIEEAPHRIPITPPSMVTSIHGTLSISVDSLIH